jgi:septal ring factor EnvC (AmiA/AmiB activator)
MEVQYEINQSRARALSASQTEPRKGKRLLAAAAIVLLWGAIGYGGYWLATQYVGKIQSQLDTIAATNEAELAQLSQKLTAMQAAMDEHRQQAEALHQQFAAVESELGAVKEEMSLAGDSLSTTASTKQALNNRINDLSKELANLRALIKKLEEAARVY